MPDFSQIIQEIRTILQLIFGNNVPKWVFPFIGWLLLTAIALCALWGTLLVLSKIKELWAQNFWPLFYNREQRQRSLRRIYFASYIESELERLGRQEEWKDYRFTELEAEVEAEGQRRIFSFIPFLQHTRNSLRREKSLSKALALSQERLILVEGEPGSGKSIALRHVAQKMAGHAKKSRSTKSIIPIYVNLKELERSNGEAIDRNLIETFILESLKRIKDRDIDKFLDEEFKLGVENGTWFFLFDSFDEIPEVLSSTEADATIKNYGDAINDFLHSMNNRCRGVVASRQFRGPKYFGWPRFVILSLSKSRQWQLIHKANLKREIENELVGQLETASNEIHSMASNPLFLNLLCEHVKDGHPFPSTTHVVFETYVQSRFRRDEERIQKRFSLDIPQLRSAAEDIAFCMVADNDLGLSPKREELKRSMQRNEMNIDDKFDTILDALEFMKLARSEGEGNTQCSKKFTFAHRRFQEYFATCVVLRDTSLVSPFQLLTDARWRETAVVMCQTQSMSVLALILEQADQLVSLLCNTVLSNIDSMVKKVLDERQNTSTGQSFILDEFPWPPKLLHILSLLQDGFVNHLADLPDSIRSSVGELLLAATKMGILSDRKWALEVAGIAPQTILIKILEDGFSSNSQILKDVAYQQVAHLSVITSNIARYIRKAIFDASKSFYLRKDRYVTRTHLMRIADSENFLSIMNLLLWNTVIDFWLHFVLGFLFLLLFAKSLFLRQTIFPLPFLLIFLFAFLLFYSYIGLSYMRIEPSLLIIGLIFRFLLICFASLLWITFIPDLQSALRHYADVVLVIILYGFLFTPCAILAAKTGKFTQYRWWILLPLWPLLFLIAYPSAIIKFFLQLKRLSFTIFLFVKTFPSKAVGIIVGIVIGCSIFFSFIIGFNWLMDNAKKPSLIANIILIIIDIAIYGTIIILTSKVVKIKLQDNLRWRKWFKMKKEPITYQEFFEATSFHSPIKRLLAIRKIRTQHLLKVTAETEIFLRTLEFEMELEQRRRTIEQHLNASSIIAISSLEQLEIKDIDGYNQFFGYDLYSKPVGSEVLDEIHRLLEDIHSKIEI